MYDIPIDSVAVGKPRIVKTTDGGYTWNMIYESDYFIGHPSNISAFGDTLILPLYTQKDQYFINYLISYDLGVSWEVKDVMYYKKYYPGVQENAFRIKWIYPITSQKFLFVVSDFLEKKLHFSLHDVSYVSVEEPIFIPESKLYPNPARDYVNIDYEAGSLPESVELYDIMGIRISRAKVYMSIGSLVIDTSDLPTGTYSVRILLNGRSINKHFVKVN